MPKEDNPFERWRAASAVKETQEISLPSGKKIAVRKYCILLDVKLGHYHFAGDSWPMMFLHTVDQVGVNALSF